MRKKYIYISLLISTGIYAIADYYCIYNFLTIPLVQEDFIPFEEKDLNKEQKKNVQYDAYAKYILSQKEVLARILKFTIAEFQDLETEVIMELIEGEPLVSKVSTEPGETNQTFHDKITGNNTENTELGEGTIFFDVIFYVRMKDGVSRIINFALNKN